MKFVLIQPIFFGNFIQEKDRLVIISGFRKIIFKKISNKEKRLLTHIISLCNGINSIKKITSQLHLLGYPKKRVFDLLKYFLNQKILVDSRRIYLHFHPYLENLSPFYHELTKKEIKSLTKKIDNFKYKGESIFLKPPKDSDFLKLTTARRTIRKFDGKKTISFQSLSGLLYASYGILSYGVSKKTKKNKEVILKRVVPSSGALYPLHIYCIVLKQIEHLSPGIYYFNKKNIHPSLVRIKRISDCDIIIKLLPGSEGMTKKASVLLTIVCNFKRISQKYSNRAYLYGILEAGHVAQNIYLYCAQQNLGVVEIGGFDDRKLSRFLGLKYPEFAPLVCFLVGPPCLKI